MKTGGAEKGESSHVAPAARVPETCGGLQGAPRPRRPPSASAGERPVGEPVRPGFPEGWSGSSFAWVAVSGKRTARVTSVSRNPAVDLETRPSRSNVRRARLGPRCQPRLRPRRPMGPSAVGGGGGGVRPAGQEAREQPGKAPQFPAGGLPEGAVLTCVSAVWAGLAPAGGPGQNSSLAFSSFWKPLRPVAGPHRRRGKSGIFSSPRLCPPGLRLLRTL